MASKLLTAWRKRKRTKSTDEYAWPPKSLEFWEDVPPPPLLRPAAIPAVVFTLREMLQATNNFSYDNFIGEGGFGRVYRGVLRTGKPVAIKQMDPTLSRGTQGEREFRVEVDLLSRLSHPSLVRLIGYCADRKQRMLVYEFMTQGSLQEHLHGIVRIKMNWQVRIRIALGSARALEYLHAGPATGNPIIHRDFKSSNILLDETFQAKVSDFGLAKLVPHGNKTYVSTRVLGTFGYFDPHYTATGRLTLKSDVYAFGVVLLELLTGRRPVDSAHSFTKQNLVFQVRDSLRDSRKLKKIIDPEISLESCSWESIKRFAMLAYCCVRDDDTRRPTMGECVAELEQLYLLILFYRRAAT
ncbi:probable serine/threonine-protein kinase PBL28 [Selaginella moellendorffii]|nr:probable serine/threonine-protein kinase PBL28 [Selaginella moellendorffii]|eukprot:XP_002964937.2 probable serine/threonine-protein kinase PBL28 [Selaginella moellendorffii]